MGSKAVTQTFRSAVSQVFNLRALERQFAPNRTEDRHRTNDSHASRITHHAGFTLIEIMVVVAIMAVVMAMSIPFARDALHKEALNKAIDDVREVCESARTLAIMRGAMTEVVFHGKDGRFEVAGTGGGEQKLSGAPKASGMSGQLADDLAFAALRINGVDILKLSEAEVARVRFYPNGTCDELRLVLLRSSTSESRGLFLEITTGMVSIESDRWKLANEVR